jgi:hypothetical protein
MERRSLTDQKLWFRRKRYGWGWEPCSKEGWFVTLLFIASLIFWGFHIENATDEGRLLEDYFFPLASTFILFIIIAYKKGEKPKWQWGRPKED